MLERRMFVGSACRCVRCDRKAATAEATAWWCTGCRRLLCDTCKFMADGAHVCGPSRTRRQRVAQESGRAGREAGEYRGAD